MSEPKKPKKLVFKEPDVEYLKKMATNPQALKELEELREALDIFIKNTKHLDPEILQKPFDI